jgi:hypothetical protein
VQIDKVCRAISRLVQLGGRGGGGGDGSGDGSGDGGGFTFERLYYAAALRIVDLMSVEHMSGGGGGGGLSPGDHVVVSGLTSDKGRALNGTYGVVVPRSQYGIGQMAADRSCVLLDGRETPIGIKVIKQTVVVEGSGSDEW